MIVTWSFIAIILIIGFIFLGIKMAETVKHGDIKIFFLALYTITLITFFNIGISLYFYFKTVKKKGQKGLRGIRGKVGDKGDTGYCEENCKVNSLKLFIIENVRDYVKNNDIDLTNVEQKVCRYFNFTDDNKDKLQEIEKLTLDDYYKIKTNIENNTSAEFKSFIDEIQKLNVDGSKKSEDEDLDDLKLEFGGDSINLIYINKAC
jgi:hypothetical protein